jgi:hypothetical protein
MDIVFLRTKLQAKIVLKMIDEGHINKFFLVQSFWHNKDEDSINVYKYYQEVSQYAARDFSFIEKNGLLRNSLFLYFLSIFAVLTKGSFYFAGINYYGFAITKKLNPFLKINTIDDGAANIRKSTIYYEQKPLEDNGSFKRRLLNYLFPQGSSFFLRRNINQHFSIYKDHENIVHPQKIKYINLEWNLKKSKSDIRILQNLANPNLKLLLGSVANEHKADIVRFLESEYNNFFDLIILHPRDKSSLTTWSNAHYFESSAEEVLFYIIEKKFINRCDIYHFGSSTLDIIKDKKITSINLLHAADEFMKKH